jgi:nucleotide-binding universal stress UspA family protein
MLETNGQGARMSSKRRSFEAGHKRKYLVVIDDTEECDRAVFWAAKRAGRTKSQIVMLRVIEPGDRNQQWLGVADIMKAEQMEAANATLDQFAARAKEIAGINPDRVIREGDTAEEIVKLIDDDADIGILVLAAGIGKEGPGPLVTSVAKTAGTFPIPVAIVPGHLNDEDLEAMA